MKYKTQGQLNLKKAEEIHNILLDDFGLSTIPQSVAADKKKLIEAYITLSNNGGDDSFMMDKHDLHLADAPVASPKKAGVETKAQKRIRLKKQLC